MNYCCNFRVKGLSHICDLIDDVKDDKIGQLKEEKSQQLVEKIPECPVSMYLAVLRRQIPSLKMCYLLGLLGPVPEGSSDHQLRLRSSHLWLLQDQSDHQGKIFSWFAGQFCSQTSNFIFRFAPRASGHSVGGPMTSRSWSAISGDEVAYSI